MSGMADAMGARSGGSRETPGTDRERSDAQSKDPSGRNRPRRLSKGPMKLPSEYADFKLADGRSLREVMGDKFFGAAGAGGDGKFMSKGVRERLAKGNAPVPGRETRTPVPGWQAALKAKYPDARIVQGGSRQAAAEARRAEQQARRDERRARMEARRATHPGGNFNFGGEL